MTQANKSFLIVCTFLSLALCIQSDLSAAKRKKPTNSSSSSAAKRSRPMIVNDSEAAREALLKYWSWSPEEICGLAAEFLPTPEEARCREAFEEFLQGDIKPVLNPPSGLALPLNTYVKLGKIRWQTKNGIYLAEKGTNQLYRAQPPLAFIRNPEKSYKLNSEDIIHVISRLEKDSKQFSKNTDASFEYDYEIKCWKLAHTLSLIWEADTPAKRDLLSSQFSGSRIDSNGLSRIWIKITGPQINMTLTFNYNQNLQPMNSLLMCYPTNSTGSPVIGFTLALDLDLFRRFKDLINTIPENKCLLQWKQQPYNFLIKYMNFYIPVPRLY